MDKAQVVFEKFAKEHTEHTDRAGGTLGGGLFGGVLTARLADNISTNVTKPTGVMGRLAPGITDKLPGLLKNKSIKTSVIGAGILAGAGAGHLLGKGLDALFPKKEELSKKAGLSSMLAKGISKLVPAVKGYGANVAKDWKVLGRGMKNIGTANKSGILTAAESAEMRALGEKQLAQGIKGLGKRVVLPGAAAMYFAND